jgi:hypothetical protein
MKTITLRVTDELDDSIERTSAEIKVSKPETIRLSIERGMEVLKAQLSRPVPVVHAESNN